MLQPVLENPIQARCKDVDHKSAELIVQHLTVKRYFLENFDQFLKSVSCSIATSSLYNVATEGTSY